MKKLFLTTLLLISFCHGTVVKYSANFIGISAGTITVDIKNKEYIECEGKTQGLFSIFYNYSFKFLKVKNTYYLKEKTQDKEEIYNTKDVLEEKAWIPVFISMLTHSDYKLGNPIKVGNINIIPEENVQNEIYFFKVQNSHNIKKVIIWYDNKDQFPKIIRIITKDTTINLKRM